jgi:hypothetical protein
LIEVLAGAGASEDLIQFIGNILHVLTEVNRKFVSEAVDHKIKQVLFL